MAATKSQAKDREDDTAASDAAVVEATNKTITLKLGEYTYSFPRKRGGAIQFRVEMQKGHDAAGVEYLLGTDQFNLWLAREADEDGVTDELAYERLLEAIGEAFGVKN